MSYIKDLDKGKKIEKKEQIDYAKGVSLSII